MLKSFRRLLQLFGGRPGKPRRSPGADALPPCERPATAEAADPFATGSTLTGRCYVVDGDTIIIRGIHIRLAGIDAPELDHPWGKKAKSALISLCNGQVVTATIQEGRTYGRLVAACVLPDGTDLSAALVEQGLALDWAKFSGGAYRHLEPQGARRKLWRVDAKHKGRLRMPGA